ncbi:hypothetical protein PGUG_02757 [Meyerozyma guilliermondii ATCC 6260]|uniref:Alkyl transferase n=2 Tax=Dikarya TaxID=451864 RepID=A5DHK6_PICGU|nr:uncharacterized protein PGUG_02757 [Meyerozyma guilliermondii ATCC 6260]EDK38659.1 hypothetical protein PGUG_02757 [Meyerozyma guilliermondii ATCC 6260]
MQPWLQNVGNINTPKSLFIQVMIFSFSCISNLADNSFVRYISTIFKDFLINMLRTGPNPKHIAFIMDGNRRFSKRNHMKLADGHSKGAEVLFEVLTTAYQLDISHVTVYAFSIENFNRPQDEVDTLFGLLRDKLAILADNETSFAQVNHVKIKIIGNRSYIPDDILSQLEEIERKTNKPDSHKVLNVCFPYTSRDDITEAMRKVVSSLVSSDLQRQDLNEDVLQHQMYMDPNTPQLDILIRTSGHTRLSDFMLWQCTANCDIEFVETLWPEFGFFQFFQILVKWGWSKTALAGWNTGRAKVYVYELPPAPPLVSVIGR